MKLLVIDVGTSGVRAAIVTPETGVGTNHHLEVLPPSPPPGLVEFDATALAAPGLDVARPGDVRRTERVHTDQFA